MKIFIIYPKEKGFAIQREDGVILARLPFGSIYSEALAKLEEVKSRPTPIQLSLNF